MNIGEFLQNFFICLGIFQIFKWMFFRKPDLTDNKNFAKINGQLVDLTKSVIAEAELVKTNGPDLWLVYDKKTAKFLTQGLTPESCIENLKTQFPEKAIYIAGFPK